jgi:hypothetical protein
VFLLRLFPFPFPFPFPFRFLFLSRATAASTSLHFLHFRALRSWCSSFLQYLHSFVLPLPLPVLPVLLVLLVRSSATVESPKCPPLL